MRTLEYQVLLVFFFYLSVVSNVEAQSYHPGNESFDSYLEELDGKRVAVVANHTSLIGNTHLVDSLLQLGVNVKLVFAPEHGFRGGADAGELVENHKDKKSGLPIISLYGRHKKPTRADLEQVDVVLFDIQDVGVRFYTYISTMHYVMEACAEQDKRFIVLDRGNPHGFYVDGPVLNMEYQSFVGMHTIPIVHGLTVGELAHMINGEGWLKNKVKCDLLVIKATNYNHDLRITLEVPPSPNLPNMRSIYLYPSLGLFEGTIMSVGRGTSTPFQVFGCPDLDAGTYSFTPVPSYGAANPKYNGINCKGFNLTERPKALPAEHRKIYLNWLQVSYAHRPKSDNFFLSNGFFDLLAGTDQLRIQIKNGLSDEEIRASWEPKLEEYLNTRKKYLLYPDFKN